MVSLIPHYINGKTINPTGRKLPVYNPALGKQSAEVGVADNKLVDEAVNAAKKAFITWSQTTATQRCKILARYKTILEREIPNLAAIVTAEHGKTLPESAASIQRGMDVLDFVCGLPAHLQGLYAA